MCQFTTSRFQHLYIHIFIYVYVNIRIYYMYINTWEHFLENLYQNDWKSSLRFWTLIPTQHNRERSTTRSRFDIFPRSLLRSLHRCQMILDACVKWYSIHHFSLLPIKLVFCRFVTTYCSVGVAIDFRMWSTPVKSALSRFSSKTKQKNDSCQ